MTTGVFGTTTGNHLNYRVWNGVDGKDELVDGFNIKKFNPYTLTRVVLNKTPSTGKYKGNYVLGGAGEGTFPRIFDNNDTIKLLARLSSRVNEHSFNSAIFAAEGHKTIKMVKDTILTVGGALVQLKHGNFASAARKLRVNKRVTRLRPNDLAGRWLELQYGWKPLINDVYEAMKAYEVITSPPRIFRTKASISRDGIYDSSTSSVNFSCLTSFRVTQVMIYEMVEKQDTVRALGLENPASVAWEILPYSFVIDWFIPIGTYLDALNQIPKLNGRWCLTKSRIFECPQTIIKQNFDDYSGATYDHSKLYVERTSGWGGLSVPPPVFRPLDKALSGLHVANAIALVTTALSKKKYRTTAD
jgi:hypothetical protein